MRRFLWVVLDALLITISLVLGLVFYFDMRPPEPHVVHTIRTIPLLIVSTVIAVKLSGLYKTIIRFASVDTFLRIVFSTLAGTGVTYIVSLLFYLTKGDGPNVFLMPRPVYLLQWLIVIFLIAWSRFAHTLSFTHVFHLGRGKAGKRGSSDARRILIIGAGYAGATVIRDIQSGRYGDAVPVAALDTDVEKIGSRIGSVPVIRQEDLRTTVDQYGVTDIIITVKNPGEDLINACVETGAKVQIYSEAKGVIRELNIADLLGRAEQHLDMSAVQEYFAGKRVMVTGGGGSIGSELCRQILSFTPEKLIIYDISENYMYDLLFELREKYGDLVGNTVKLEVGSVRDEESLWRVMGRYKPNVVIHAAAHKHVPLMEDSPEQAILNNVFGTEKTVRVAEACGVERFVLISTDKAVNPTNVMGASKRLAEMIVSAYSTTATSSDSSDSPVARGNGAEGEKLNGRNKGMACMAVRFGNVLGSHGSVVPIFERQIRAGGPITLTHSEIIRYFMTIPEAASLVLQAASIAQGGELYVLDMGEPVKIKDLAERMIRLYGNGDEKIAYTGLRPGEKLYEELLRDEENDIATEVDRVYRTRQQAMSRQEIEQILEKLTRALESHTDIKRTLAEVVPTYQQS